MALLALRAGFGKRVVSDRLLATAAVCLVLPDIDVLVHHRRRLRHLRRKGNLLTGARVLCIGEGMAELSGDGSGAYRLGFGGDTLNTALYMARLLGPGQVGYVTRLGDDLYSAKMRAGWEAEGSDCALV